MPDAGMTAVADAAVGVREVRMVEDVENIRSELQLHLSFIGMFFIADRSHWKNAGPRRAFRPTSPIFRAYPKSRCIPEEPRTHCCCSCRTGQLAPPTSRGWPGT